MTLRTGDIVYLPPDSLPGGDPKTRPHVLVSSGAERVEVATLAMCSSQPTEADAYGAPHFVAHGAPVDYRTGLTGPTHVYCSRLVAYETVELEPLKSDRGDLRHEKDRIRACVQAATGLGTGTATGAGTAQGSLRGRIVEVAPSFADEAGMRYGVVISNPAYSKEQRYMNIVPVFDADAFFEAPGDVVVSKQPWLAELNMRRAIIAVSLIQSLYYPDHVSRPTGAVVDGETIETLDDRLVAHLGL